MSESDIDTSKSDRVLRVVTYLVPHLPLGLYQTYQYYLEEALDIPVTLMVESRWNKPATDGDDLFTRNQADLGFMHTLPFLARNPDTPAMELLPVAPVHEHPRGQQEPVHFADVIVHSSNDERFTVFDDLKGFRCGFSHDHSVSSNLVTQRELRKMGTNNSFFGEVILTGCDTASIDRVVHYDIDAAVVDSNCLSCYLAERPDLKKKVKIVATWGPLPVQPVVVNSSLPADLKDEIAKALLSMNESPKWQEALRKYSVLGFKANSEDNYIDIKAATQDKSRDDISVKAVYY